MSDESATILKIGANGGVVQLPGRNFPGLVIQGDSLSILHSTLSEAREALRNNRADEAAEPLDDALESVASRLSFYESTLLAAGLTLPYSRRP